MGRFNNGCVSSTVLLMAALASSTPVSLDGAELSPGDLIVADIGRDAVFRIDPVTGDRTVLSGMGVGSGPSLLQVRGVAVDRWGQIYVTDAESTRRRVVRIDPISGSRTLVSGTDRGTGPNLVAPFALAFDSEGELYLSDISTGLDAIFHIDIRTGEIRWELPQPGPGISWGGTLATATGLVFVAEETGALLAVDAVSGAPLWSFQTHQLWRASPMTYMFDGTQYVAIANGNNVIAFAIR